MSLIHVEYNDKTFTYTATNTSALTQELYDKSCTYFTANRLTHKLIVNNKQRTPVDRSQPIRLLLAGRTTKLALVEQKNRSEQVNVTLDYNNTVIQLGNTHVDTSLYDILLRLEQPPYSHTLFGVIGTPAVEENDKYSVTINVPGLMQPVVEHNQRKYGYQPNHNGNAELQQTTLASLGLRSDSMQSNRVKLRVSVQYIAPRQTEAEKRAIIETFDAKMRERQAELTAQFDAESDNVAAQIEADLVKQDSEPTATATDNDERMSNTSAATQPATTDTTAASQPSTTQQQQAQSTPTGGNEAALHYDTSVLPKPGEIRTDIPGVTIVAPTHFKTQSTQPLSAYTQPSAMPRPAVPIEDIVIPQHRHRRLFYAPPGSVKVDDIPDEFFELSDEDVAVYARSLLTQMTLSKANQHVVEQIKQAARPSKTVEHYNKSVIRFRLPDHLFVEAWFKPTETVADLKSFLADILHADVLPTYYLYITPPRTKLDIGRHTLKSYGLVNMCIVNVHVSTAHQHNSHNDMDTKQHIGDDRVGYGVIRDDLLSNVVHLPRQSDSTDGSTADGAATLSADRPNPIVPVELD